MVIKNERIKRSQKLIIMKQNLKNCVMKVKHYMVHKSLYVEGKQN